jgi:hypothetical protein
MRGASLLSFTQLFITVSVILELTFQPRMSDHHQLNHSYKKYVLDDSCKNELASAESSSNHDSYMNE